ncbi:MAG: aminotransferase class V-fold PLP-dependent enzyme [Planctomycetes bacterium]|nr:aminotransferase class V-fold PLP-dependent enzyme [Planctomycetota bacterium]
MMYFDHAATSLPKPPGVAAAMTAALNTCGNPSRGAHGPSLAALRLLLVLRQEVAEMFGVGDPARVVFTANATHALNLAIGGVRGHIVATAADHNSVLRPLHRRGTFSLVPVDETGRLRPEDIDRAIRHDTEAVVMTHASNVTGTVYDLTAIAAICRRRGVRLIVDAAQTAGLLPLDLTALNLAALCFSGHKSLCGPPGTGALCLGPGFRPAPLAVGGSGSASFSPLPPDHLPEALEAGTPNIPGLAGLAAGIAHVRARGASGLAAADRLARRFVARVQALDDYILYGDLQAAERMPIVAINHRTLDGAELARRLDSEFGIAVRAGAHCAPLMHRALGTGERGAVRFSFSPANRDDEVDQAVTALRGIAAAI